MDRVWILQRSNAEGGAIVLGVYSTELLAIEARARAAKLEGTTIYDEMFNLFGMKLDWMSSTEREMLDDERPNEEPQDERPGASDHEMKF